MEEKLTLLDMFAQYRCQDEVWELLTATTVQSADIDPSTRKISVALMAEKYISQKQLDGIRREICDLYGLQDLELQVTFEGESAEEGESTFWDELFYGSTLGVPNIFLIVILIIGIIAFFALT